MKKFLNEQYENDQPDSLSEEELTQIWTEISDETDIEDVWNKISVELDNSAPLFQSPGIILRSIACLLFVLLGLVPVIKRSSRNMDAGHHNGSIEGRVAKNETGFSGFDSLMTNLASENDRILSVGGSPLATLGESNSESITLHAKENIVRAEKILPVAAARTNINIDNVFMESTIPDFKGYIQLDNSDLQLVSTADNLPRITVLPLRNSLIHDERLTGSYLASRPIKNLEGKISFGTITSFRNTWLLNSKTFDGFRPESLTTTEFVFFPDLGLSMDYRLRGLWSLHSEVYFHSTKGQKYREYIYGHYTTRDISLRYSTAALCFKRKFLTDSYLLQGASFNMISGIYFSALHNAEQIISTVPEDIRTQYHNFDFGFWLGGEIEIP